MARSPSTPTVCRNSWSIRAVGSVRRNRAKRRQAACSGSCAHEQIERMRGRQHRQQMRAPQLRCTQSVPPPASKIARTNPSNEVIGGVRTHQFEQMVGAHGRQSQTHAQTLTQTSAGTTPHLYRRSHRHLNRLQKLSEHPLIRCVESSKRLYEKIYCWFNDVLWCGACHSRSRPAHQ